MSKVDMIIDLQYGSTGKGAIAGYLATTVPYDTVVSANRPNAGHTFIDRHGNKMIHKVLPNGVAGPSVRTALIGAGAVFSVEQLIKEIEVLDEFGYNNFNVFIHEAAVILTEEHKNAEEAYSRIGSTQQGAAQAIINKMDRDPNNDPTAKFADINHPRVDIVDNSHYQGMLVQADKILAEGAQGYSLGIDAGFWPYCTSRNCTVNSFMSDMGIPHTMLRKVIGSCRTYPIRVAGNSGPYYPDQEELDWEDVGVEPEKTTVTKKVRRVFTFSQQQITDAIRENQPDEVFLNFCNYLEPDEVSAIAAEINGALEDECGGWVRYYGNGPAVDDIVDLESELDQYA